MRKSAVLFCDFLRKYSAQHNTGFWGESSFFMWIFVYMKQMYLLS